MTTPIESSRRAGTHWWRSAPTVGLVLAGAFAAILLGVVTSGEWAGVAASLAGFAIAITVIAATVSSWEHVVVNARDSGLVGSPGLATARVDERGSSHW